MSSFLLMCNVETHANIFVLNISLLVEDRANNPVQKAAAVPLSWSFLNGLLNHVVKELNDEKVLKLPIFVIQKAAAPKIGVEFCQGFNGTIRSSLATSQDITVFQPIRPRKELIRLFDESPI